MALSLYKTGKDKRGKKKREKQCSKSKLVNDMTDNDQEDKKEMHQETESKQDIYCSNEGLKNDKLNEVSNNKQIKESLIVNHKHNNDNISQSETLMGYANVNNNNLVHYSNEIMNKWKDRDMVADNYHESNNNKDQVLRNNKNNDRFKDKNEKIKDKIRKMISKTNELKYRKQSEISILNEQQMKLQNLLDTCHSRNSNTKTLRDEIKNITKICNKKRKQLTKQCQPKKLGVMDIDEKDEINNSVTLMGFCNVINNSQPLLGIGKHNNMIGITLMGNTET